MIDRATVRQKKTGRPVKFELMDTPAVVRRVDHSESPVAWTSPPAAPAPRSATRRGRIRARHDGVVRSLTPEFARVWKSRADDAIVLAARFQKLKRNPAVGATLSRWRKPKANPPFTCVNMTPT